MEEVEGERNLKVEPSLKWLGKEVAKEVGVVCAGRYMYI